MPEAPRAASAASAAAERAARDAAAAAQRAERDAAHPSREICNSSEYRVMEDNSRRGSEVRESNPSIDRSNKYKANATLQASFGVGSPPVAAHSTLVEVWKLERDYVCVTRPSLIACENGATNFKFTTQTTLNKTDGINHNTMK